MSFDALFVQHLVKAWDFVVDDGSHDMHGLQEESQPRLEHLLKISFRHQGLEHLISLDQDCVGATGRGSLPAFELAH